MLSIRNVSKTYSNGVKALNDVTIDIPCGMFGLLGPNGAGKSSLMRTIATLQSPDSGTIVLGDLDIQAEPTKLRAQLGYLPQEFGVYPGISAAALLDHLAVLKGIHSTNDRNHQVEALLHRTNLYAARNKAVSTFSGGMRQRFGIAQALLGDPRIVIVDEPTAGLDPEERNRFLNMLGEIGEEVVVILSTHIVEDVHNLCQRMAILSSGKILLEGTPGDLVGTLQDRIWECTVARDEVDTVKQAHNVISSHLVGGKTRLHVLSDTRPAPTFTPRHPDLEDVYFSALA